MVFLIGFATDRNGPGYSCQFISQGNRGFILAFLFNQSGHPDIQGIVLFMRMIHNGPCAIDQHFTQVRVAAFAYA